jgi:hypothetical protein
VYSQNVVGYVNVPLPAVGTGNGLAIIANPLNGTNNTLATVIPNPPNGTIIYKFTGSTLAGTFFFQPDDDNNLNWGGDAGVIIKPGDAFWIKNPGAATSLTFVGEVPQGSLTNIVPAGLSMRASIVPQAGRLDGLNPGLGYPAVVNSTTVHRFIPGTGYATSNYGLDDDSNPAWDLIPNINVAEGFWVSETAQRSWIRNFTVQ